MASGAGKKKDLAAIHARLTKVYLRVLERYEMRMEALEKFTPEQRAEFEDSFLGELFEENAIPPASMLKVIQDFLKQQDVGFDTEDVQELSEMETRLAEQRRLRVSRAGGTRNTLSLIDPTDE